jgi:hypothetical protein
MEYIMKLWFYDEEKQKSFITDKFSVIQKYKYFESDDGGNVFYELFNYESTDMKAFMEHSELVDFLKDFYGCDTVVDVFEKYDMGMDYQYEQGFFIIRNDVVEQFVHIKYAYGLRDGINSRR